MAWALVSGQSPVPERPYKGRTLSEWQQPLRDPNPAVRAGAVEAMGHFGARAVPTLIQALEDKDWLVQHRALQVLRQLGSTENTAVAALGQLGPAAAPAVPALVHARTDPHWDGLTSSRARRLQSRRGAGLSRPTGGDWKVRRNGRAHGRRARSEWDEDGIGESSEREHKGLDEAVVVATVLDALQVERLKGSRVRDREQQKEEPDRNEMKRPAGQTSAARWDHPVPHGERSETCPA